MARRGSFADLANHWDYIAVEIDAAPIDAATVVAPIIANSIKETFGHAPPLRDLAPSTQEDRANHGYAPNNPLVRTEALKESYHSAIAEGDKPGSMIAMAGSHNRMAAWHEHGYFNVRAQKLVPPRPAALIGFNESQSMARRIWKNLIGRLVKGRS